MTHIISIDAETNGLAGQAFAVAMTLSDGFNGELDHKVFRCPIVGEVHPWVAENVLPAIADVEVGCDSYAVMIAELLWVYGVWITRFPNPRPYVVAHIPWPVEARLLADMFPGENVWSGPYPLIDVAPVLLAHGNDPLSVDDYLKAHAIPVPEGSPHNPLYDARAAERCLRHLLAVKP